MFCAMIKIPRQLVVATIFRFIFNVCHYYRNSSGDYLYSYCLCCLKSLLFSWYFPLKFCRIYFVFLTVQSRPEKWFFYHSLSLDLHGIINSLYSIIKFSEEFERKKTNKINAMFLPDLKCNRHAGPIAEEEICERNVKYMDLVKL